MVATHLSLWSLNGTYFICRSAAKQKKCKLRQNWNMAFGCWARLVRWEFSAKCETKNLAMGFMHCRSKGQV